MTKLEGGYVPPATGALVVNRSFASRFTGTSVDYSLALPSGSALSDPLPVCFCLPVAA